MEGKRTDQDRRQRVIGYALGMIHESAWILALTLLAFAAAVLAKVMFP